MEWIPADIASGVLIGAFTLIGVLVQRGRRETTERFDRLAASIADLLITVAALDKRQDEAAIERAVIRNEVDTIKDRHAVVDMLHRRGVHRGSRRGLWLAESWLVIMLVRLFK